MNQPNKNKKKPLPITVKDKNDPRYIAYKDSLDLYKSFKNVEKSLNSNTDYELGIHSRYNKNNTAPDKLGSSKLNTPRNSAMFKSYETLDKKYKKDLGNGKYEALDMQDAMVNNNLPKQLYNKKIKPAGITEYISKKRYNFLNKPDYIDINGISANLASFITGKDIRGVFNYSNINPKRKVIIDNKATLSNDTREIDSTIGKQVKEDNKRGMVYNEKLVTPKPRPKIAALPVNLKPKDIDTSDNTLKGKAVPTPVSKFVKPKSYKVEEEINMNFGGTNTKYEVSDAELVRTNDLGPGNKRTVTPQYRDGGSINDNNNSTMRQPSKKKIPKAFYGAAISAGVGLITSKIAADAAKKEQNRSQLAAQSANFDQSVIEQDVYANQFERNNINDLPTFANGGDMDVTNNPSSTGKLDATGGDLIPISDNAEVVAGNKHSENKIDGSYGVTLSNGKEPIANVEDDEVIVNNDLVFSDKLKKGNRTFADIALAVNTKIGDLQANLKSATKPAEKFSLERTIQGLEKSNQNLFNEQELVKQNTVGSEQEMVEVENGVVPKGSYGFTMGKHINPIKEVTATDSIMDGIGETEDTFLKDFLPLMGDNIANFAMTKNAPKPAKPITRRAPIFDTRVNANPQLADINNAVTSSNEVVRGNTNNSAVARANITASNLKGSQMKTGIQGQVQAQERQMQNQQNQVLASTANSNAELTDKYNEDVYQNIVEKNASYSENVSNLVEDYTAVKQNKLNKEADEDLINIGLANDPTGEKARSYARLGKSMSPKNRAILRRELERQEQIRNSKK